MNIDRWNTYPFKFRIPQIEYDFHQIFLLDTVLKPFFFFSFRSNFIIFLYQILKMMAKEMIQTDILFIITYLLDINDLQEELLNYITNKIWNGLPTTGLKTLYMKASEKFPIDDIPPFFLDFNKFDELCTTYNIFSNFEEKEK